MNDVRFVKDGVARALRTLRVATSPEPGDRVVLLSAQMIGLRFTAAALAAGVGIVPFVVELRVTDSRSPLRSHLYYATSATTPSGGLIASRAPTRCCRSR